MSCGSVWRKPHPDVHMARLCSDCREPGGARSLCTLCNKQLCCRCADLHQHPNRTAPPLHPLEPDAPPTSAGSVRWLTGAPPCPLHGQELLELFCETCDVLSCSRCHLSSHADHRLVHVRQALRDQQWLFENLTAQLEDKRSAMENSAKQIESRIHGIKVLQRKAENQIKMAKMIIMNELNKRTNLLTEQLKKMSGDVKQQLEAHLQGLVELCSELGHMQSFLAWATSHHRRTQLLFGKELITFQMQRLFESHTHADLGPPVKIRFNWDASFWTKQISTLGQLTAEGGSRPPPESRACPGVLRPRPIACPALPASLCHRALQQACGFQAYFQPQPCCPRCVDPKAPGDPCDLLVNSGRGSPGSQGRCVPLKPYAKQVDVENVQQNSSSQLCPPREAWEKEGLQDPVTQTQHHPQQLSSGQDSRGCGFGSSPPEPLQRCPEPPPTGVHSWVDLDQLKLVMKRSRLEVDRQRPRAVADPGGLDLGGAEAEEPQQQQPQQQQGEPSPVPACNADPTANWQSLEGARLLPSSSCSRSVSASPEMSLPVRGSQWGRRPESRSAPSPTHTPAPSLRDARPTGAARNLATAGGEQGNATGQAPRRLVSEGAEPVTPPPTQTCHRLSVLRSWHVSTYKSESDNAYAYKEVGAEQRNGRLGASSQENISPREAVVAGPRQSTVLHGCLERMKARATAGQQPLQAQKQCSPHLCPDLHPAGGTEEHRIQAGASEERVPTTDMNRLPPNSLDQTPSCSLPEYPQIEPCSQERLEQHPSLIQRRPQADLESDAGPESESEPRSETEPDIESEPDLESEADLEPELDQNPESDMGLESDQQPELELEPQQESEVDIDSNPELESEMASAQPEESEPDVEPGAQGEAEPCLESEIGLSADAGAYTMVPSVEDSIPSECSDRHAGGGVEMENEDFCAVCLNGGDLLCCDRCPKVFHLSCHVPPLLSFPTGDWVCTLCRDVQKPEVEYDCESSKGKGAQHGLSACDRRKCEKLTLFIYCNILSGPFHEPVSPLARHYYQIIKKPMDLSVIRSKLTKKGPQQYCTPEEFVADVLLMFRNCAKFNYPDSEVAQAGQSLEIFFNSKLEEIYPERTFPALDDDSDSDDYEDFPTAGMAGFPWPDGREHSHRKRKRRRSLNWRKHHF
ncbi:tripartite motif-containing protein 66-like isoform X2 [Scleropages formosus]|uniref:tripartite motif-containing protein 66-like isoform X2 n=1 Tax=Scleropages formosus TaxID=113540 RepID=UPI0010FA881A|nr:tripartite motif-containing protein 66-like isoform X2 [Scleropages formosus]